MCNALVRYGTENRPYVTPATSSSSARAERRSPPAQRVVTVIDALAARPGTRMGLSEIARVTRISKATCLGIVNELCDAGWLVRSGDPKAYSLGPALLAAGTAAQRSHAALALARPSLRRLADELGAVCTASTVMGGDVVVLARVGDDTIAPAVRPGQTFPFAPPSGVMFVAWEDDRRVEAWLSSVPLTTDTAAIAELRAVVAACRRQGFLVETLGDFNLGLYSRLAELLDELPERYAEVVEQMMSTITQQDYIRYLTDDLRPRETYAVSHVCAPVLDADAHTHLLLAVFLMRTAVPYGELRRCADALVEAASAVTTAIGGRDPWLDHET